MEIFFVNSEAKSGPSYHDEWMRRNVAVTSGSSEYEKSLSKISRGDWVLLYVNNKGVVAAGIALDGDPVNVTGEERVNPIPKGQIEYHRPVDWHLDLRDCPIGIKELRKLIGWIPRPAVQRVEKGKKELLQKIESLQLKQPTADSEEIVRRASELRRRGRIERPTGVEKPLQTKGETTLFYRDPEVRAWILQRANGKCELCATAAPFLTESEECYLESHHIVWLAEGGSDTPGNTAALCPNCHRELHFGADRKNKSEHLRSAVQNKESDSE